MVTDDNLLRVAHVVNATKNIAYWTYGKEITAAANWVMHSTPPPSASLGTCTGQRHWSDSVTSFAQFKKLNLTPTTELHLLNITFLSKNKFA